MKALTPSKTAIAVALASAALVTGCGQNEEVSQAEQETTSTAAAAGESVTPPAEAITNPDTGATAQTGANTDVEYGTAGSSEAATSSNLTAERSGPPAGETAPPHTTTDMVAVSPAPAAVDDSIATSDAAQSQQSANVTERTTPDAGANAPQQTTGATLADSQQSADESISGEQQVSETSDQQQATGSSDQQSGDTSGAVGGAASDTWITTKVKSALLADDQVSGTDIEVETTNGEVMLSGFVENQQQIQQAEQAVQQVEGVRQVNNKLEVKQQQAEADTAQTSGSATETERTASDAEANTSQQTAGAAMVGSQQSSDASVTREQQASETSDQQQASGSSNQQSEDTSGAVGGAVSDTWITTKVKSALLADGQVSGTDVEVETANGEVMLSGFVENQQQIQQAEQVAQQVEGVRQVTTNLKVKQQQ